MMRRSFTCVALAALALAPSLAFAQGDASIAGVVTDNTGGILPGVTIEASSSVLIEGSRIAVTDGTGQFNLVDLRPGMYNITFTLPGFSIVLVENQELPAGFTLTLDAELSVGALEETVTVSGAAPVIDVQSVTQSEVLSREVLDAIPTGRNMQSTAQLIPGVKLNRPEVGLTTAAQQTYMSVHGMAVQQTTTMIDGQHVASSGYDGANQNYINLLANQEMVYETSGITAETSTGGVRISMIPREGGNAHSGQNYFGFSNGSLQNSNLSQRLQDRGATSVESIRNVFDLNVAHGGPIIQDRLWFFSSFRRYQLDVPVTNSFYQNREGTTSRYFNHNPVKLDGEGGREFLPGINDDRMTSGLLRLTTQVTRNSKFSAYLDRIIKQRFHDYDARVDVGTASRHHGSPLYYVGAAKWTSTLSSRLLLEVGYSSTIENWSNVDQEAEPPFGPGGILGGASAAYTHTQPFQPGVFPTCVASPCYPGDPGYVGLAFPGLQAQVDNGGGVGMDIASQIHPYYANTLRRDTQANFADRYHWGDRRAYVERFNTNSSVSYVTGSHNLKLGLMTSFGPFRHIEEMNGALRQRYSNEATPRQVGRTNHFSDYALSYIDMAGYVQDTWTMDRLTLNMGFRYETLNASVVATERPIDTRWTRAIPGGIPGIENLPSWGDIAPRIGVAYDLFGNARTALKASWGRYNASSTHSLADRFHTGKVQYENLPWFDCAMTAANECASRESLAATYGAEVAAMAYGTRTDQYARENAGAANGHPVYGGTNGDDYVQDWELGVGRPTFGGPTETPQLAADVERPWVGLTNIGIDHELLTGLSVSANYYRRDTHGGLRQLNRARGSEDFVYFEVPNPCFGSGAAAPNGFPCATRSGAATDPILPVYALTAAAQLETPDNWIQNIASSPRGDYTESYNGFEGGFNIRAQNGTTVFGGYTVERNVIERCDSPDDPNHWLFCDASEYGVPWLQEFKVSGTVPLPGDFSISATFQSYTPREILAIGTYAGATSGGLNGGGTLWGSLLRLGNVGYRVDTADFPATGQRVNGDGSLSGEMVAVDKTSSVFLPTMPSGSTYTDRLNQFDVSFRKIFELPGGKRLNVQADIYNILNFSPILETSTEYGSSLGNVLRSIQGRFVQLATHLYW